VIRKTTIKQQVSIPICFPSSPPVYSPYSSKKVHKAQQISPFQGFLFSAKVHRSALKTTHFGGKFGGIRKLKISDAPKLPNQFPVRGFQSQLQEVKI
jgi:hypothetical protein